MRWLHAGSSEEHLLAARLLARHVPASTDAVDAFLETVRGWAMTTQHPANEILRQASRAAHHPSLVGWLTDLMRDEAAPWQSRTEAAAALAVRLREDHNGDAIALLRAAVDDPSAGVKHRLVAAEALAHSGANEREAAEHGLRSVLRDPSATGDSCRTAAFLLAAFGASARNDAIVALSDLLSNDHTPTQDRVDAATGLVEIGVEFHERSAGVFLDVLRSPVRSIAGRREAALGLASLGPQRLAEAVNALTDLTADRSHLIVHRAITVEVLAELGPQNRVAAAELLLDMSAEPGLMLHERWVCAARLAQCGSKYRERAITQLRSVIADHRTAGGTKMWAAKSLAELGPEFHTEASQEWHRQLTDPFTSELIRVNALDELVALGEPHRSPALQQLQDYLADCGADPMTRCHAAVKLIRSGPEFHDEVVTHLLALARSQWDPAVIARAWRELLSLRTTFREEGMKVLIDLVRSKHSDFEVLSDAVLAFTSSGAENPQPLAAVMRSVMADPTRNTRVRATAARELAALGSRFHRTSVAGVRELLRSDLVRAGKYVRAGQRNRRVAGRCAA